MSISKKIFLGVCVLSVIVILALSSMLFETNSAGYMQVKQAAGTGTMSVRLAPGV